MLARRTTLAIIFCFLISPPAILAQATSAILSGTVSDSQGAVVSGAAVIITNTETGQQRRVRSGERGDYRVVGLSPGAYELSIEAQGFETQRRAGINLTVADETIVDFNLTTGVVREAVVVSGATQGVETSNATLSGLVDERRIRDLPLNGRDMAQLILLQPGVVNSRTSVQSANTGRGTRFSVSGARPSQNIFQLDGTTLNDALNNTPGGAQGLLVGVETVKEFRVLTNAYGAEYGRAAGGVFLAVTKSGTNSFTGSAFEFLRNDNLDARNFFDREKPEFRRNQFGFTAGGAVVKNKTFFFGGYEGLREFKGISIVAVVPNDAARLGILPTGNVTVDSRSLPLLDLYPRANGRNLGSGTAEYTGTTDRLSDYDFFTARVDHVFSASDSIFVRYLFDDSSQVLPRSFPEFFNLATNRKQVVTIEERKIITPNTVNELRFGFNRSTPSEVVPPVARGVSLVAGRELGEINVEGLSPIGTDRLNPKHFNQNNFQFADNIAIVRNSHGIKAGVSYDYFQFDGYSEARSRGRLRFRNLADLLRFRVRDLEGASADSDFARDFRQSLVGFYIQDDYTFARRLTLNLGLRYEFVTAPSESEGKIANLRNMLDRAVTVGTPFFRLTRKNFAPRFGFAYDLFGDGRTALRGGFGIFHEHPLFNVYRTSAFNGLPFVNSSRLTAAQVPALPVDPSLFTGGALATDALQFELRPTYIMQYNLNLQREVIPDTVVTAAYVGSRGVNLIGPADLNTAVGQRLADGRTFFPAGSTRRNTTFDAVRTHIQGFNSFYNALNLSVVRRAGTNLRYQASYTFGKSIDERSGIGGRSEFSNGQARSFDPYDRRLDRARSDFDVRHNFVANLTYDLPFGRTGGGLVNHIIRAYQINTIVTLSSGLPFTVNVSGDPDRDGTDDNTARPNLIPGVSLSPPGGRRSPDLWFNPAAFAPPTPGFRGTAGRNILTGPDYQSVDFSLVREFAIGERGRLQFRAEAFNLFNRVNFDLPSNSEDGAQVFTFTPPATFTPTPSVGRIFRTIGDSRELQFGLKLLF